MSFSVLSHWFSTGVIPFLTPKRTFGNVWSDFDCHNLEGRASNEQRAEMTLSRPECPGQSPYQRIVWSSIKSWTMALVVLLTSMRLIFHIRLLCCQGTEQVRSFWGLLVFLLHYWGANFSSVSYEICDYTYVWDLGQSTSRSVFLFPRLQNGDKTSPYLMKFFQEEERSCIW